LIQARKRKLGLPVDDDNSQSVETASLENTNNAPTVAKTRGIFLFCICCKFCLGQIALLNCFSYIHCVFMSSFSIDSSDRAFYKDLVKVIEASDVILEVLDARDPLGTRCVDIEKMVMKSGPDKRLVLLLNKIGNSPGHHLSPFSV
jgi:nuclear GTP-binding protein